MGGQVPSHELDGSCLDRGYVYPEDSWPNVRCGKAQDWLEILHWYSWNHHVAGGTVCQRGPAHSEIVRSRCELLALIPDLQSEMGSQMRHQEATEVAETDDADRALARGGARRLMLRGTLVP